MTDPLEQAKRDAETIAKAINRASAILQQHALAIAKGFNEAAAEYQKSIAAQCDAARKEHDLGDEAKEFYANPINLSAEQVLAAKEAIKANDPWAVGVRACSCLHTWAEHNSKVGCTECSCFMYAIASPPSAAEREQAAEDVLQRSSTAPGGRFGPEEERLRKNWPVCTCGHLATHHRYRTDSSLGSLRGSCAQRHCHCNEYQQQDPA